MAVYQIKRKKPDQAPKGRETRAQETASPMTEETGNPSAISRTRNRSLDAYVGSGQKARRTKENGGVLVDAVYNKRETARETSVNDTDRILLEAFADDKKAKKERKKKEKELAAERKRLEKERRKQEKQNSKKGEEDPFGEALEQEDDELSQVDSLYSSEELASMSPREYTPSQEKGKAAEEKAAQKQEEAEQKAFVMDDSFFESLLASVQEKESEKAPSGAEEKAAEEASGKKEEPAFQEIPAEKEPVVQEIRESEEVTVPQQEKKSETDFVDELLSMEDEVPVQLEKEEKSALAEEKTGEELYAEDFEKTKQVLPSGKPVTESMLRELYGEDSSMSQTREFDVSGLDAATVKTILEKEAQEGKKLEKSSEDSIAPQDLFNDEVGEEDLSPLAPKSRTEEFTEKESAEEMTEGIKDKSAKMLAGAVWTFVLTLLSFYLATGCFTGIPRPAFLMPGKSGIVLLLVDLQFLIISGVLIWQNIFSGFGKLFRGKADPDSVTAVGMAVVLLYQLSLLITSATDEKLMLFGAVGCFLAFLNCVYHFMDERRSYRAFRVVASKKDKLVARRLGLESSEYEALKEHLPEDPDIFTIEKTKFVNRYFARSRDIGKLSTSYNVAVWMVLAVALVFGIYNLSGGAAQMFKSFTVVTLFGLPACSLFVIALPLGKLSKKCAANGSAVIGVNAMQEYSTASVLSFNDTELFPANKIRLTSIRTFGNHRIDKSILYAAMIFKKVGGPLSRVFSDALSGSYGPIDQNFDILENTGDGICAKINGREVFVGNKDYMLSYDFGYVNDEIDEPFENSVGRIMYMAVGDRIAAKFYIRYAVNGKFERVMRSLYKSGICISIKTCDPNLDNELIKCIMKNRDYPVCVLKTAGASLEQPMSEAADSGIVCTSSILNMLRAFIRCEKTKRLVGVNLLVKFISVFVGLFVSVLLCFMGRMDSITTAFVIFYQLLWLMAVIVPSLTE